MDKIALSTQIMPKVFISYSHKDEVWKERLQTQLSVLESQGLLSVWDDRKIAAGDDWYQEIEQAIQSAHVAILLISADFLSSGFILGKEVPPLLERRKKEGLWVIPLILKPCPWQAVPWLSKIQGRPKDNQPLSGFKEHDQDHCLSELALEINEQLNSIPPSIKPDIPENPAAPRSINPYPVNTKPSLNLLSDSSNVLNRIKYHFPTAKDHVDVRQIEQNICCIGIKENRAVWIISEWGMAADSFMWVVQNKLNESSANIYRIDINEYTTREKFLNEIQGQLGCSFEQLCELLSVQNPAYLVFDDVPVGEGSIKGNYGFEYDLEDMVKTILQYCPNLRVLLRSRRIPNETTFPVVELKSFDELDTKTYVLAHKLGGKPLSEADVITQLYRHTDGVPSQIDTALKDLELISLSELSGLNTDVAGNTISTVVVPDALVRAVYTISDASDPTLKRSFELLKTLTILPQGETLERIRRFNGADGFYPANARELLDRALIDSVAQTGIGSPISTNYAIKTLVVKRPVREYVYSLLDISEIRKLNHNAISLYFGEKWSSGEFKSAPEFKFDSSQRTPFEIANASIIIQRLMHEAISSDIESKINIALRVASFFSAALVKGSHYRSALAFFNDFLPLIPPSKFIRIHNELRCRFASCLRMVKETQQAKSILLQIRDYDFDKPVRLQILLDLALCHQSLKEKEDALKVSREIKRLDQKSSAAMQAEAIIIELATDDPERHKKLLKLEATARRKGEVIVANNIALVLVAEMDDHDEIRKTIFEVITTAKSKNDLYTMTRAIVKLGKLAIDDNILLTLNEQSLLINSYHYLYNQRISSLFNDCHQALWSMFERMNDIPNLLKLFRHTSLIWRLRGQETLEQECAQELIKFLRNSPQIDDKSAEKENAYFSFRTSLLAVNQTQLGS